MNQLPPAICKTNNLLGTSRFKVKRILIIRLIIMILMFIPVYSYAQDKPNSDYSLSMSISRTFEGSGDLNGISYNSYMKKHINQNLDWFIAIGGTIADGEHPLKYKPDGSGPYLDGSIRYTTAGLQLSGGVNLNLISNTKSELFIGAGPLLRYQTSSNAGADISYPETTGLPYPVVRFQHSEPARTFSPGGIVNVGYNYTFNKGIFIGVLGSFQTDTNGDTISQMGVNFGKRF